MKLTREEGATQTVARRALLARLERNGIFHAYVVDPTVHIAMTFYSDERIIARGRHNEGRFAEYPRRVDAALHAGDPVALVGRTRMLRGVAQSLQGFEPLSPRMTTVHDRYFVVHPVTAAEVERLGFLLNPAGLAP